MIEQQIRSALRSAIGLIVISIALLIATGEIWIEQQEPAKGLIYVVNGISAPLATRLWTILAWDLFIASVLLWLLSDYCDPDIAEQMSHSNVSVKAFYSLEALLSLGVTFTLWRLVFMSGWALITATGLEAVITNRQQFLTLWLVTALILVWKEALAQNLESTGVRCESVLLEAYAWHHRKDGVFSVLFALSLTWGFWGGNVQQADLVLNLVKILLLGSAANRLTRKSVGKLLKTNDSIASTSNQFSKTIHSNIDTCIGGTNAKERETPK